MIGSLNKRVRVERKAKDRNPIDNSEIITWELFRYWRVSINDDPKSPSGESDSMDLRQSTRSSEVRGRWIPGLTSDMRLVREDDRGDRIMNILSVSEIGLKEGLICQVETYTTEGQGG